MDLRIDLSNKKSIAGIIILLCIIMVIFYLPSLMNEFKSDVCTIDGSCQHEAQLDLVNKTIPLFLIGGIAIGAIVFFFMTNKIDNTKKDTQKIVNALINFLNKDEKKIVEVLIENNGKIFQSEISRIEGIGKLKSHRIIQKLVDRNVIVVEKHGKTNIIKLSKEIKEVIIK